MLLVVIPLAFLLTLAPVTAQNNSQPVQYDGLTFPELPYPSRWIEVNDAKMHYLEGGDPTADPILFLHGNPTWSYLWRDIMPIVEPQGRVIAVDLIGMGRSDQPDISYTIADHQDYLTGFVDAMGLENITLVVHDWGSGLGFDYAANHPDNIQAVVFMESMIPPVVGSPLGDLPVPYQELFNPLRTEGVGEELILNQNFFVETILADDMPLSGDELNPYRAPFPTPAERQPILMFPRQVPFGGQPADTAARFQNYVNWLSETQTPMLMFTVAPGFLMPEPAITWAEENITNLDRVDLGQGGHFIQELYPQEIGDGIAEWIAVGNA